MLPDEGGVPEPDDDEPWEGNCGWDGELLLPLPEPDDGGEYGLEGPPLDEPGVLPAPTGLLVLPPDGDEPGVEGAPGAGCSGWVTGCEPDPTGLLLEPGEGVAGGEDPPWPEDEMGTTGAELVSGTLAVVGPCAGGTVEEITEVIVLVTVDTVKVVWMLVLPPVVIVFVTGQVVT